MNPLIYIIAFFSEVAGTMAGFGSSTIALPLFLFLLDFQTALVLVAFLHLFGNIGRIGYFRHGIDKNLMIKFGIPGVILTIPGALLVPLIDQNILKGLLGVLLIVYSIFSFWKHIFYVKPTTLNKIIGGAGSGFVAGILGTGGAIRGAFLSSFRLSKEKYIATAAAVALAVDATRIPIYLKANFLETQYWQYLPALFVVAIAGSYTGKLIINKISQKKFNKLVSLAILMAGAYFVYGWII
jgi:uncharacterized protein